jgi:hypothetical protein
MAWNVPLKKTVNEWDYECDEGFKVCAAVENWRIWLAFTAFLTSQS